MRFIHTADWQLGKPFGGFDAETRNALTEARFDAIDAVGKAAAAHNAQHVLVAGDVFDTEGPDERTIVQALARMERYACKWWLLPGNHDFARNGGLWDRVRKRAGGRVAVLASHDPVEMEDGVWLLPAPLLHRHMVDDPTAAWDDMETPGARLRIGLAHGSIRDFGTSGEAPNLIAPDRARRARLDYLALGDWHGHLGVDDRTWYSGTPETDRFQRDEPGHCLQVELAEGAAPRVTPVRTGRYQWLARSWTVSDAAGFRAECDRLLGDCTPSDTLLRLNLAGLVPLADRVSMIGHIEDDLRHLLRHLEIRDGDLVARPSEDDLAALDAEGMLGRAAAILKERAEAGGSESALARRALERLFVEIARQGA
ncbi:hypothetical protein FHS61_002952 [Altererythrobacter atlanticus]|uniref:Nuclease SbcCD subunit D n=1 Tax=Croceibacterium atlanticum TaxID=1267766 RepID=A0A0F7KYJ8_9SPHN|nr:DNA repair exonuclease [Croceibacterium atlanticum]AKH44312.1 Nuclease SbcCD subunit D [Croceibacterium atlanticum]MBB5733905.1 hypothetical protein [Croceibacterium atlanticum]